MEYVVLAKVQCVVEANSEEDAKFSVMENIEWALDDYDYIEIIAAQEASE